MSGPQHRKRFRDSLTRAMREIDMLRTEQAAIQATREATLPRNRFLTVAFIGLLGDRLIRLMRIFDLHKDAASFWYLHRCEPWRFPNLDIERLQKFSDRLKNVRDVSFVHTDKRGISEATAAWKEAGFTEYEFRDVIEMLRSGLLNVWIEEFGKPPIPITDNEDPRDYGTDFDGLKGLMKRSIAQISVTNPSR